MRRWLGIVVALLMAWSSGTAQTANSDAADVDAIRQVAELYISGAPDKLQAAFDPQANLYTTDENGALRIIPFHEYLERVKANAASNDGRQRTLGAIQHAGSAAMVEVITMAPELRVTDYLSLLRLKGKWKVISKTFFFDRQARSSTAISPPSQAAPDSTCRDREHHRFDFMIGTWQTSDSSDGSTPAIGNSSVESMLEGCVIHEHRQVTRQGKVLFDGDAYWGNDVTTKRSLLFYVDNAAHMQVYEGREEGGEVAFYRERPDPDGKSVLIRILYEPTPGGYTQTVERSIDHGTTWKSGGITAYLPKR